MGSEIRQFENALNLLVNGVLREEDSQSKVAEIVRALQRVASDWAENLSVPDNPTVEDMEVSLTAFGVELKRDPVNLETAILFLVQEHADLGGAAETKKFLTETAGRIF